VRSKLTRQMIVRGLPETLPIHLRFCCLTRVFFSRVSCDDSNTLRFSYMLACVNKYRNYSTCSLEIYISQRGIYFSLNLHYSSFDDYYTNIQTDDNIHAANNDLIS